ncbi:hypothetical protein CBOM_00148 [Ceraceosorus bombacis]|uniref:Uncharacterized protein n=1 Tax=Ceraceosorus bombacis TaxID=401625 RepID=A0A0P1B8E8_9BASI|nr:hypothetical protein CBOM_00148 [Ceraceosorus bombacis]
MSIIRELPGLLGAALVKYCVMLGSLHASGRESSTLRRHHCSNNSVISSQRTEQGVQKIGFRAQDTTLASGD